MQRGRHGERYLLGAVNWTFVKFFDRLERLTKVASPRLAFPSKFAITGAHVIDSLFRQWNLTSPLEADTIEMAEYFWYFNHNKARRELGFTPRDPGDTLNDTVHYVRENFLGGMR
jgi:dihydroflavonol-4-reductase